MSAHTPGPWKSEYYSPRTQSVRSNCSLIAQLFFDPLLMDSEEHEDNASLIAAATTNPHECDLPSCEGGKAWRLWKAAPEMADLLKAILISLGGPEAESGSWADEIRAVLTKAGAP